MQASAGHYRPVLNHPVEHRGSAESAIFSGLRAQPSAQIHPLPESLPGQIPINPQPLTVSRGFVHRRLSDAGPLTGSITHTWPASEPLTGSKSKALTPPHQYQTFGGPGMAVADHRMEMAFAVVR